MVITETKIIYAPSQTEAYAKVIRLYKDKKNMKLNYMHRISHKKYAVNFSYEQDDDMSKERKKYD